MMSAPPTTTTTYTMADSYFNPTAEDRLPPFPPYYQVSPASRASDSTPEWPASSNASASKQRKSSSPANETGSGGFHFVTSNNLEGFKDKKVMQQVRKKAMNNFLEKKPKNHPSVRRVDDGGRVADIPRSRLTSQDSTGSQNSELQEGDIIENAEALKIFRREPRRGGGRNSSNASSNTSPAPATTMTDIFQQLYDNIPLAGPSKPKNKGFVMAIAPIVIPMRENTPLPYNQYSIDSYQSISEQDVPLTPSDPSPQLGKSFDPFLSMYQNPTIPVGFEKLKWHCSRAFGTKAMGQHWIPTLIEAPHTFLSTLCIASTHLDAVSDSGKESLQTIALRQEVISRIQGCITSPTTNMDDLNIIAITQLICSEIISGEQPSLQYHTNGVTEMVRLRGGLDKLGVKGRLASTLAWVSLESAILREDSPKDIYSNYSAAVKVPKYPTTATIPESPLFCPHGDFNTLKRSSRCSKQTLELLSDMRTMIDLFLSTHPSGKQKDKSLNDLYKKITRCRSDNRDWTYEACRIAAEIQATAIFKRIPISEALKIRAQAHQAQTQIQTNLSMTSFNSATLPSPSSSTSLVSPTAAFRIDSPYSTSPPNPTFLSSAPISSTSPDFNMNFWPTQPPKKYSQSQSQASYEPTTSTLLQSLKTAINNSNISDCWSEMAGVLLWVSLVAGASASTKNFNSEKLLRKWFSALAVRCSIYLCFEHPEAILSTLRRMVEVQGVCSGTESGIPINTSSTDLIRRSSSGKKRRVESSGWN